MTLRIITASLIVAMAAIASHAKGLTEDLNHNVRLGYSIGGTAPVGMPATIRKLNSYDFQPNISFCFDVQKTIYGRFGVLTGLHLENKGMKVDATVKNYHMEIEQDGNTLQGYFTGRNITKVEEWLITLPIMATMQLGKGVMLKLGPYVSYVMSKDFEGEVYNGYLRNNTPTGTKINFGTESDERGTFDFSSDMRHWQVGIDFGADWYFCRRWGVYADITWGVTGIHKSDFKTIEQTLYPIFGTLGVTYKLK